MTRTRKLLGLSAFLAATFLAAPAFAADVELPKTTDEKLDEILKGQARIEKRLEEFDALKREVGDLRNRLSTLRAEMDIQSKNDKDTIQDLKSRIAKLEETIARLDGDVKTLRSAPQTNISRYPPDTVGRINLINNYDRQATFLIDGRSYRVAARQSLPLVDQPVGTHTYEVLVDGYGVVQPPVTLQVMANRTAVIEVFTR